MWLNILRKYVHTRTFFTLKIHPPLITLPATWPCQPPDPASHLTLPATHPAYHPPCPPPHPARYPTLPATTPCLRPTLPALSALATTASLSLRCAGAVLVFQRRLYVWGEGHLIIYIPYLITYIPYLIFYLPYLIFYIPHLIFYIPHLIS